MNHPIALKKAKHNVSKHYPVVGVLEMFNTTLNVMEGTLPKFFRGAVDTYYNDPFFENYEYRNLETRKRVSEGIKSLVRTNLTNEIEFYEFCVQRLHFQFSAIHSKRL